MNLTPDITPSIFTNYNKYDVFISFFGKDTRQNFTSFLYYALCEKKIKAYIDEESLRKGDEISSALLKAIGESKISLIIFSKKYAFSKWCLKELVHILKCKDEKGQVVVPIFYGVDPSHVRNQEGSYADAFVEHENNLKFTVEKLSEWRAALRKAGSLSGWDLQGRYEPKLIKMIVKDVLSRLKKITSRYTEDRESMVGVDFELEKMISFLNLGSSDVRIFGLWGMAGVGKSTLARAIFHRLSYEFEGCCFLENVREESIRQGLARLESKLFSELLKEEDMIGMVQDYVMSRIRQQKVLIVLDDVDDPLQLSRLVGDRTRFGSGSRIIITSRDRRLLKYCDTIYKARALYQEEALHFFSIKAFGDSRHEQEPDYHELSKVIVDYSKGLPLLLKLLGSFLRGESKLEWISMLNKLRSAVSNSTLSQILRMFFEGLGDEEKDSLLHIAFLKGNDMDSVEEKLEESGLYGRKGIQALMEKSLISLKDDGQVWMHDSIQEMAWEIIHQESTQERGKNSSSLIAQAVYHVWKTNKETGGVRGKYFNVSMIDYEDLHPILQMLRKGSYPPRYLSWTTDPHNLDELHMHNGRLEQFRNEIQDTSWSVGFYISCEGEWRMIRGQWRFNGKKTKGITVPRGINYHELVERLCTTLMIDRSQYDMKMRYLPNLVGPWAPVAIENNEDVHFFISESSRKDSLHSPLCITLVRKDTGQHVSKAVRGWVWRLTNRWQAGSRMMKLLQSQPKAAR